MKTIALFYIFLCLIGFLFFIYSPIFNQFYAQLGGGLAFWLGICYLTVRYPLRGVLSSLRSRSGWYILLSYLSVHYLAYSLLLDKILGISLSTGFGLTYAPMESIGLNNGIGLLFSPSISMGNSQFYLDLSFFSLVMGLVIGLLVLGNIAELRRLRGLRRDVSLVGLPLAGIVSGSTCCISIASILSYYAPIVVTGMALVLLDVGYVGLPFLTAIFLWLNYKNLKHVNIVLVEKLKWGPQLK